MFKKRLKKIACIVLSTALAVTGAGTGLSGNTVQVSAESKNILDNPSFAADTSGWYVTGGGADNLVYTADGKIHGILWPRILQARWKMERNMILAAG